MIDSIHIENFRLLSQLTCPIESSEIFLIAPNAQGKTSFLEAIHYLLLGSSFLTRADKQMIQQGKEYFFLQGHSHLFDWQNIQVGYHKNGKKQHKIDGKIVDKRADLLDFPISICAMPEDWYKLFSSATSIREFFDQILCLQNKQYLKNWRLYYKVLKYRNSLLKQNNNLAFYYDESLAQYANYIIEQRQRWVLKFNQKLKEWINLFYYNQKWQLCYHSSWSENTKENILQYLKKNQQKDLQYQNTTTGIHRDKFEFIKDQESFIQNSSMGQKRLLSIMTRLIQAETQQEQTKMQPILLIDDVLLELDKTKQQIILQKIRNFSQVFYTFLPKDGFESLSHSHTQIIFLKDGKVL